MKRATHTTWLTRIGVVILICTAAITASFSAASNAQDFDAQISPQVDKAVTCFVYARDKGASEEIQGVYLQRIGKASGTAGAVWRLGYVTGLVDGLASANAKQLGGFEAAKVHAADYMYKLIGCTINESI